MVLLPEGFGLPPLPYAIAILIGTIAVGYGFYVRRPSIEEAHVVALGAWMAVGAAVHALYQLAALPAAAEPLAGTPAVYVTTAIVVGAGWLLADITIDPDRVPVAIAASGGLLFVALAGWVVQIGRRAGTLELIWPAIGVVVSIALTAGIWVALARFRPAATATTGWVGVLTVFAHVFDAISTSVGVDVLGFGERTPLSRRILLFAEGLPTEPYLGSGWLFVVVKVALVVAIVLLMRDYVAEEPVEGRLLLGFIAAVGLGPGTHNVLLFVAGAGV